MTNEGLQEPPADESGTPAIPAVRKRKLHLPERARAAKEDRDSSSDDYDGKVVGKVEPALRDDRDRQQSQS